ncbi:hypothetical protein D3C73_1321190 [compost metagenome]
MFHHHAIRHQTGVAHGLLVAPLFDDSSFIQTRSQIGNVAMPTRDNGGGHLAGGFEVVKTDGDIKTRRLAVHQFNHRDPRYFDHFQRTRGVAAFGEDKAIDIPR